MRCQPERGSVLKHSRRGLPTNTGRGTGKGAWRGRRGGSGQSLLHRANPGGDICKGSYTLEAAIVLPVVLMVTFSLIYLGMHIYQKLIMAESAVYASVQVASAWGDSGQDIESGFSEELPRDGLYWRLYRDMPGSDLVKVKIASAQELMDSRLQAAAMKTVVMGGPKLEICFVNRIISRRILTRAEAALYTPSGPLIRPMTGSEPRIEARADVAEPVEFIRTCELGAEYLQDILAYLKKFGGDREPPQPEKVRLIASRYPYGEDCEEKVYHYEGCPHIKRIKYPVYFDSVEEARRAGYRLCLDCAKRKAEELAAAAGKYGSER